MFERGHLGKFKIPIKAFQYPEIVTEILGKVIVVSANYDLVTNCIYYIAIGDCFKSIHESGLVTPYYIECDRRLTERPLGFTEENLQHDWLHEKLYSCLRCLDESTVICGRCSGSGESMNGGICRNCKGTGEAHCQLCGE